MMDLLSNKKGDHSLTPDIVTGWKSSLTLYPFKQLPIYFTNPEADMLSKSLTSFRAAEPYRVVYMGPRYSSNLKAFKAYSRNQKCDDNQKDESAMYGETFSKYDFKFGSVKQKLFSIRPLQYRLFSGMNPTIRKSDLQFDSNFECGNLDLAILINTLQYDLLMRVDSNSKGHTTWFYFKVTNFSHQQRVRFNLINFQKSGLLYNEGMKPYCFRSSRMEWEQDGMEVEFRNKKFRYNQQDEDPIMKRCLSFSFQFSAEDSYVYFAYCVPYSYSFMLHQIAKLQKENPHFVFIDQSNFSTGGLMIPVLTITNSSNLSEKQSCLAIGRLHPGQTQGSWMMDGFLSFLCSQKGFFLREKFIFKIVPMVNVDGVVLGNYRTSIAGRDLNRFFHRYNQFQEVTLIRSIADKISPLIFLDFHGHSAKRNVFMYGPNYGVDHKHYLTCRLLPKIISKLTNAFRYYSCLFKISECKINASRSVMLRETKVAFAYTIEASSHGYGPKVQNNIFRKDSYRMVGEKIAQSLINFVVILFKLPKRLENQIEEKEKGRQGGSPGKMTRKKSKEKKTQSSSNLLDFNRSLMEILSEEKELFEQLLNDEKLLENEQKNDKKQGVSDSDFEEGCQYTDKQLKALIMPQGQDESILNLKGNTSVLKKKKKKKKKESQYKLDTSLKTPIKQSKTEPLKQEKSFVSLDKQLLPIKKRVERKLKVISVQQLQAPQMPSVKSSILDSYALTMQLEESASPDSIFNKVHYKNWKKFQEPSSAFIPSYLYHQKMKSVNHINLSYSEIQKEGEEEESKKSIEKDVRHAARRLKKKTYMKQSEFSKMSEKSDDVFYVKQSILPVLNKKSFNERQSNLSLIQQLVQSRGKLQSYANRNLKILYF